MEDLYIELLRYGKKHLVDGVTMPDTLAHLRELQPESLLVQNPGDFINAAFSSAFNPIASTGGELDSRRYLLNMEGYFNLLEHDELQEARKSSRNALWVAIGAIVISGTLAAVSVYLQLSSEFNFWPNA